MLDRFSALGRCMNKNIFLFLVGFTSFILYGQSIETRMFRINQIISNDYYQWLVLIDSPPESLTVRLKDTDSIEISESGFIDQIVSFSIHDIVAITYFPDLFLNSKDIAFYAKDPGIKYADEDTVEFWNRKFIVLEHEDSAMLLLKEFRNLFVDLGLKKPSTSCPMFKSDQEDRKYWATQLNKETEDTVEIYGIKKKITGRVIVKYPNGTIRAQHHFKKGLCDGVQTYYRENGPMYYQQSYKNGILDGEIIEWDENGKVEDRQKYVNGKLVE